jgi:hypothetical protein
MADLRMGTEAAECVTASTTMEALPEAVFAVLADLCHEE